MTVISAKMKNCCMLLTAAGIDYRQHNSEEEDGNDNQNTSNNSD
jgi:hypothetical protein